MTEPADEIDCRRAHELLSRRMDGPLEPAAQLRLKLHLAVCEWCVRVERQMNLLREAMRRFGK